MALDRYEGYVVSSPAAGRGWERDKEPAGRERLLPTTCAMPSGTLRVVRSSLEAYSYQAGEISDSWLEDHHLSQRCYEFEDTLADGVRIYTVLASVRRLYRERVNEGSVPYDVEHELSILDAFKGWLRAYQQIQPTLDMYESNFGSVAHASRLRNYVQSVRNYIAEGTLKDQLAAATPGNEQLLSIALPKSDESGATTDTQEDCPF